MEPVSDAIDRWFVRRGMPQAIRGYTATGDVWTRAWPFLLFVLFVELFATFGDEFAGWEQVVVFVGGLTTIVVAFVVVNLIRRRRPFRLPDDISALELAAFVVAPPSVQLMIDTDRVRSAVGLAAFNLLILAVVYPIVRFGLLPGLRVGLVQAINQFRTFVQLVARGLPLLLVITAFVFLNAEMWQVAHDFPPIYFAIVVAMLVGLAIGFLVLQVPREVDGLARFGSWDECRSLAARTDAPLPDRADPGGPPGDPELSRYEIINIGMLLTISQVVQTMLVGAATAMFYVVFGMLAVRRETILQWTTTTELDPLLDLRLFGDQLVLTWEHLAVAGFVGTFAMLQFSVASVTDATYRNDFYDDVAADVREVLAVRALVRMD